LAAAADPLAAAMAFDAATLEASLRGFCDLRGEPFPALVHPLRVAVSGRGEGPGLFELLALLGRDRTVARLRRVVDRLRTGGFGTLAQ
jgi:glutamyl/glutaminyl-tRNA synthetase